MTPYLYHHVYRGGYWYHKVGTGTYNGKTVYLSVRDTTQPTNSCGNLGSGSAPDAWSCGACLDSYMLPYNPNYNGGGKWTWSQNVVKLTIVECWYVAGVTTCNPYP